LVENYFTHITEKTTTKDIKNQQAILYYIFKKIAKMGQMSDNFETCTQFE